MTISGEGIPEPIIAQFDIQNGQTEFNIEKIPAGEERLFLIEALGAEGAALYSGEAKAAIKPNEVTTVDITMKKVGGGSDTGKADIVILWPQD